MAGTVADLAAWRARFTAVYASIYATITIVRSAVTK
jgi:hypothetical protein